MLEAGVKALTAEVEALRWDAEVKPDAAMALAVDGDAADGWATFEFRIPAAGGELQRADVACCAVVDGRRGGERGCMRPEPRLPSFITLRSVICV